MASSIRKAQSILQCQWCDSVAVLRWKCETCDLLLCEKCKVTRHLRVKGADKHSVIPIKDVGTDKADDKETDDETEMFASLEISQPREVNAKVVSSILCTYTTDLPAVHRIVCFGNGKICYINNQKDKIITASLHRGSIEILQVRSEKIFDMTINKSNELLTAYFDDSLSKLKIVSEKEDPEVVYDCSPLRILGMHYNKKTNELFLGVRDSGPMFLVTQYSNRPVIILGPGYKRKAVLEFTADGKRFFRYPAHIDTDDDGTIYIVDSFDDKYWFGRLVALSRDGDLKFTYNGHDQVNSFWCPFNPTGIAVTQSNHIVIADNWNHALHVLQTDGQLIGLQRTKEIGIKYPFSLAIDTKGFLLIGCTQDEPEKAKIHVVKLSM